MLYITLQYPIKEEIYAIIYPATSDKEGFMLYLTLQYPIKGIYVILNPAISNKRGFML